jgi:hypothetical protein
VSEGKGHTEVTVVGETVGVPAPTSGTIHPFAQRTPYQRSPNIATRCDSQSRQLSTAAAYVETGHRVIRSVVLGTGVVSVLAILFIPGVALNACLASVEIGASITAAYYFSSFGDNRPAAMLKAAKGLTLYAARIRRLLDCEENEVTRACLLQMNELAEIELASTEENWTFLTDLAEATDDKKRRRILRWLLWPSR